jgi:cytidyltransferase-like protein
MKIVYTKVVADLFHMGHVNFLKAARQMGDRLVVHVVDDDRVEAFKNRRPIMSQQERLAVVAACRHVDETVPDGPKVITRQFMEQRGYALYAYACASGQERQQKRMDSPDLPDSMLGLCSYTPGLSTTEIIQRVQARHLSG